MNLDWKIGLSDTPSLACAEYFKGSVPGCAILDYKEAKNLPEINYGTNFKAYHFLEKKYIHYKTTAKIEKGGKHPFFVLEQCDYQYELYINGTLILAHEGLNGKHVIDLKTYEGSEISIDILFSPPPMCDDTGSRTAARKVVKPAVSYEWDWHPRLIPIGIYKKADVEYHDSDFLYDMVVSYELTDALDEALVSVTFKSMQPVKKVTLNLQDGSNTAFTVTKESPTDNKIEFSLKNPKLWYPNGYGKPELYTLQLCTESDILEKQIGFRQVRLVMNEGAWRAGDWSFPKTRAPFPITLVVNGLKIFGKGANFVNPDIFLSSMNKEKYRELIQFAVDANMNLLRCWGGAPVDLDAFFEACNELGIMVWQEFPLACNDYPDEKHYINTLKVEAENILDRLSGFPCVCMLCGGNELFNEWSGMNDQSHALRLLNSLCFEHERNIPFLATSPLFGMGHGHYRNVEKSGLETITTLVHSNFTAYTEFGCPGASEPDYIRSFMSEEEFQAFSRSKDSPWSAHHAFHAWDSEETWLSAFEVDFYFGGHDSVEDLCEKSAMVQSICYKAYYEEMRKHAPYCTMALCWCYNEPWPSAANNSLLNFPALPKKAYYSVKDALRPRMTSLRAEKLLWLTGETFTGELWMLNDSLEDIAPKKIRASVTINGVKRELLTWEFEGVQAGKNLQGPSVSFVTEPCGQFTITLECGEDASLNSAYTLFNRDTQKITYKPGTNNI